MEYKIIVTHYQVDGDVEVADWFKSFTWNFLPFVGMSLRIPGGFLKVKAVDYDTQENEFWVETEKSPHFPRFDDGWELSEKLEGWKEFVKDGIDGM